MRKRALPHPIPSRERNALHDVGDDLWRSECKRCQYLRLFLSRGLELAPGLGNVGKRRQARLIAQMLDLVGRGRLRQQEMLLPVPCRIGEVGMDVSAVEDVSRSTGIDDSIRRYAKRGKRPNATRLVTPD